jgi:hypothetical protein
VPLEQSGERFARPDRAFDAPAVVREDDVRDVSRWRRHLAAGARDGQKSHERQQNRRSSHPSGGV